MKKLSATALGSITAVVAALTSGVASASTTSSAASAPLLTGVVIHSANASGVYDTSSTKLDWETYPGIAHWALAVTSATNGVVDANQTWPWIEFKLTQPENSFVLRGDARSPSVQGWNRLNYGIDLFFDKNVAAPSIRGFLTCDVSNTATNLCTLNGTPNPSSASNSLSATFEGGYKVTLKAASWKYGDSDLMNSSFMTSNHQNDRLGSMTLTVAQVPEPESYAMMIAGLGLIGGIARRKKTQKTA